jgi:hypothetical protein
MPPLSLCLNEFGGTCLGGQMHTRTLIFIFAYVPFLGVSHMTYCSETRDTKTAVREGLNLIILANSNSCETNLGYESR